MSIHGSFPHVHIADLGSLRPADFGLAAPIRQIATLKSKLPQKIETTQHRYVDIRRGSLSKPVKLYGSRLKASSGR